MLRELHLPIWVLSLRRIKLQITGAQLIIECLIEQGVDRVFGYPGGQVIPLYDALYMNRDRIKHILTAHVISPISRETLSTHEVPRQQSLPSSQPGVEGLEDSQLL